MHEITFRDKSWDVRVAILSPTFNMMIMDVNEVRQSLANKKTVPLRYGYLVARTPRNAHILTIVSHEACKHQDSSTDYTMKNYKYTVYIYMSYFAK